MGHPRSKSILQAPSYMAWPRRPALPRLLALRLLALSLLVCAASAGQEPPLAPEPTLSLSQAWRLARGLDPGYAVEADGLAAADAEREALRRDLWPELALEVGGDAGQRARPSEERAVGFGSRGDAVVRASWTVGDSARRARSQELERRRAAIAAAGVVFDSGRRAALARIYVEVGTLEQRHGLLAQQRRALESLAQRVRRRVEAGVERGAEAHWIDEALARSDRVLDDGARDLELARTELAGYLGGGVRVAPIAPRAPEPDDLAGQLLGPRTLLLERQAEALEARSEVLGQQGRWSVRLLAAGGSYFSEAFDDDYEPEYLAGFSARWSPDLGGARRQRALAEQHRARAARAEAARERTDLELHRTLAQETWQRHGARLAVLEEELRRAEQLERVTTLRWGQGAERWRDVQGARERVQEAELRRLDAGRELARSLVDFAEAAGRLDALPAWLGQGAW